MRRDMRFEPGFDRSRRRFLTTTGGGALAVAVFGLAACGSADEATTTVAPSAPPTTGAGAQGTTSAPTSTAPASTSDDVGERVAYSWDQVALDIVSAYVLSRAGRAVVVDTGIPGSVEAIEAGLGKVGLGWDGVDDIIVTHKHNDHAGSLLDVLERAPAANAYAGELDLPEMGAETRLTAIGDGEEVSGLFIVTTPGHTPGHISVFDPGGSILLSGDALNGGDALGGEPGTVRGANPEFTADIASADDSIRKLAAIGPDVILFGHGAPVVGGAAPMLNELAASL